MQRYLKNLSIKRKLVAITMIVTSVALVLMFTAFMVYDYIQLRQVLVHRLTATSRIIGSNSIAALIFEDHQEAASILSALKTEGDVTQAVLFDAGGRRVAEYRRDRLRPVDIHPGNDAYAFVDEHLVVSHRVIYNNATAGTIVLVSDLNELIRRPLRYLLLFIATIGAALVFSFALSSRLQHLITQPILGLVRTMTNVSETRDYSLRAERHGSDELGILVDGFNEMLAQIHERDVTLQEMNALLMAQSEELRDYAERLERSNRELQDFASVASHDLQEPLRKVQAFSERLTRTLNGQLTAQGSDYLERMLNAVRRMQVLINDLLSYSRVTTKAQPFMRVDLGVLVSEVLSDLEIRIEQHGHNVAVGCLPCIDADPLQMRQLFQNLIGNALKFHKPGHSAHVRIESDIERGADADGPVSEPSGSCRIVVSDDGIGFDEKYAEQIFVIFQRLHSRTEYEGTGIGLAICRKIVDRHHGSIAASSVEGSGATFTIRLPLRQPGPIIHSN